MIWVPRRYVEEVLAKVDIRVNGDRAWDIQVHNDKLFRHVVQKGSLGLGEAYVDGWWDAEALDQFFFKVLRVDLERYVDSNQRTLFSLLSRVLRNSHRPSRTYDIGRNHYDAGNDLYRRMLDARLTYTCGYWKDVGTLDLAQEAKLALVCRKLHLRPGMRVLDIGCGWGSFAKFAAENYGVSVVGIAVSKEQVHLGQSLCRGLPVELRLEDYRDTSGTYDRVVSLGMFEHVGYKNYPLFMRKVRQLLNEDGLFLLHTIGNNRSLVAGDPWLDAYIFPEGMPPSIRQIGAAIEKQFVMEDWQNFGADYDKTLMAWFQNFDTAWPQLKMHYDDRFYRMWKYYLLSCAGSFRARHIQLWQIVLSAKGVLGGYSSVR